ncbi:putative transporter [Pseudocercospora fuligena]|uniref:Putative transporter n=1 Tax=Pseudocercospora fuligena TaxID=685502 RepID=A0A8H6RDJ3_9PEZI|nr:putative transporter [Pseudocercospora fuligena]
MASTSSIEKLPQVGVAFEEPANPTKESGLDDAYVFLRDNATLDANEVDLKRLRRKIDRHLLPLCFCIRFMQGLDGHLLNYAIVMGLPEDLNLKGQQLNNIASSIHWVHIAAAIFVGVYLNKFALGKSLGGSMLIWGVLVTCTAAVSKYQQMLAIRLLMGVFDCLFTPTLMLITSQFYRKDEQALRFQLWFCSIGFAQVCGAFISYGFQSVNTTGLYSWQIMYLVLGLSTIVVSCWVIACLPDSAVKAKFLNRAEKVALLRHISSNATGVSSHRIKPKQMVAVLVDPQIWLLMLAVLLTGFGGGIMSNYGSTLMRSFGYSRKQSTLLNAPGGGINIVGCLFAAWVVHKRYLQRWSMIALSYAVAFMGACLIAFPPHRNQAAHLAGIFLFAFSTSTVGIKLQWIAANVAGHTKRPIAMTLLSAGYTAGTIAGPYAVQKKDAPDYYLAKHSIVASKAGCLGLVCMLALYYLLANRHRDRVHGKPKVEELDDYRAFDEACMSEVWANLTDKERKKTFRYVY